MGRRGPAPKPTAIRRLEGNPSGRPLPEDEPQPPALFDPLKPPGWLKGKGRTVWNTVLPILVNCRVMSEVDLLSFARYCDIFDEWFKLRAHIKKYGTTLPIADADGRIVKVVEKPEFKQYRTLNRDILRMEQEFGLTPAARSRVRVLLEIVPPSPGSANPKIESNTEDDGFDFGDS